MNIEAFLKFTYGVYIVSSSDKDERNAFVANTVFQVTAEPPQLAVSCNKNNLTTGLITRSGKFGISILKQQAGSELIGTFGYKSGRDLDKFRGIQTITGETGIPIVTEDAVAWFECEVTGQMDVGTHIVIIGKVINGELIASDATSLTYTWYREVKKGFSPKNAPTYVDPDKVAHRASIPVASGKKYRCLACNYIYDPAIGDPDSGILPGTAFEDIPDNWMCPVCGATKDMFEPMP